VFLSYFSFVYFFAFVSQEAEFLAFLFFFSKFFIPPFRQVVSFYTQSSNVDLPTFSAELESFFFITWRPVLLSKPDQLLPFFPPVVVFFFSPLRMTFSGCG